MASPSWCSRKTQLAAAPARIPPSIAPMAPRGEARLVDDLRDFLDDFAFRAKRLAAPLLQPFGPFSEPSDIDDGELDKLRSKLKRIRVTLRAAEDRVVVDDFVKLWLRELRDLEHAAEDVLEELEFEALHAARLEQFKIQLLRSGAGKRKREINSMFSSSSDRLKGKIGKIMERYNEIARDRDALRLRNSDGARRLEASPLTPTSSLTKCRLHGRQRDKRLVTELLLSEEANCSSDVYSVVPVVGPSGVGKTTLVQHIYNDETLSSKFDIKMWVCVCQEFDVLKLTRKLAEEVTESPCCFTQMNQMHRVITDRLREKRFLLVLDDVWNESQADWESLQVPLKFAAPGSKILVTTRSTKVAKIMALKIHQLGYLSETDSWFVCRDAVLRGRDPNIIDDNLISIGKSVAARCKGLPLAANAIGNVLSSAVERNHWKTVEQSDLWDNEEVVGQTIPALLMSYGSLQKHLKRCFSYCSLFPKEYLFRKDKLVRLWLAQGFVEADNECHADDIACKYFDDLVEKFFLQRSPYNEERYFMHDLYHELAGYVSAKEFSRMEKATSCNVDEDARHISLAPSEGSNEIVQFCALYNQYKDGSHISGLRTLLVVQKDEPKDDGNILRINFPIGLMKLFGSLRVLDLSNTDIEVLPDSVGELIHLRYLSLENTKIKCLPESISALFKLHTMNLKYCNYLSELPKGIKFLTKLRHLELPSMDNWNVYMPHGIGELTNLQTMHMIKVGVDPTSCGITDLVNLDKLRGELCISGIENVSVAQISVEATIKDKSQLRKLVLHWSSIDSMFADEVSSVLHSLQPHSDLEELIIWGFSGVRFPLWLGSEYMSRLSNLELKVCPNCKELPCLGQIPSLKHLSISSLTSIKNVGRMFSSCDDTSCKDFGSSTSRAFPMLETLKFTNMDSWQNWDEIEPTDFPRIQHLTIIRCNKLRELPKLEALQNLRIKSCEHLRDLPSFPSLQCIKIEGSCSIRDILQIPVFSHIEMIELQCYEKFMSEERLKHFTPRYSLRLKKEQLHKISEFQTLPFQDLFVQDSQKSWTFIRGARRILECTCNFVECTDLTFGQINVRLSEDEISKDVWSRAEEPEDTELVSCKPVWVRMGQLEEIEFVCID